MRILLAALVVFFVGTLLYIAFGTSGGYDPKYSGVAQIDDSTPLLAAHNLHCYKDDGTGKIRVLFENYGKVPIDLGDVDVNAITYMEEEPRDDLSIQGLNMTAEARETEPRIEAYEAKQTEDAATDPGAPSYYIISLDGEFETGIRYEFTFTMNNEDDLTAEKTCIAE